MFDKLIEFGKVLVQIVHCGHVLCSVFEIMGTRCTLCIPLVMFPNGPVLKLILSDHIQVSLTPCVGGAEYLERMGRNYIIMSTH